MKKHFFYFLLTAFVFNLLFLNNFALAQYESTGRILCYGCQVYDTIGVTPTCNPFEPDSAQPDNADIIKCCTISEGGQVLSVDDAEKCDVGGNGSGCKWWDLFCHLGNFWNSVKIKVANVFLGILILIVSIIAFALWVVLVAPLFLAASIINFVSNLNPFEGDNSPAKALWNALKTWGYIILTFVGLYAGFQWLFGEDTKAKKLIFNILLVALLINFTFLFVQEAFNIVWQIEKGISRSSSSGVGGIFLEKAAMMSPWSLANAIGAGDRMPGGAGIDLRDNFIGAVAQSFNDYASSTINDIFSSDTLIFDKLIAAVFGALLSLVFTFITLLITVIALVLYVARYFVITFLAALSSIAIASVAFPEIKVGGKSFSLNLFDQWFSYFVRWVLVIPVFLILFLASHNLLTTYINVGGINAGSLQNLAQTVFGLIVIVGSFLLSVIFAVEFTGAAAALAKGFVLGASAYLGGLAVGKALELSGNKIAGVLEKTGGTIAKSPLPMSLRARGVQLQKKAEELRESFHKRALANRQALVGYHLETLRQAVTDQEKKQALRGLLGIIEREKNSWMRKQLIRGLNLSDEDFEKILTDGKYADEAERILSLMGGSEAPRESREWLAKRIKGLPAKKLILASTNPVLYKMWGALHPEVQENFLEAIKGQKTEDLIKEFAKLKKNDWQNISQLSQLNLNAYEAIRKKFDEASHNAFTGFIEAVVNNDISTLRANIPFYPGIFGHLDKIADLIGPYNAQRLLIEGLRTASVETIDNFYPTWFRMRNQLKQLQKLQKLQKLTPQQLQQLKQLSKLLSRSQTAINTLAALLTAKGRWGDLPGPTRTRINALSSAKI